MSGIKYYRLGENEELPDEFCAVRDVNGEPSEYTFYERMNKFDRYMWSVFKQDSWVVSSEYRDLMDKYIKLQDLTYERAHEYAIQHMTEDELRVTATNVMNENARLRELIAELHSLATSELVYVGYDHDGEYEYRIGAAEKAMRELGVEVSDA